MKRLKRVITPVIALAMVFTLLAGCGGKTGSTATETTTQAQETQSQEIINCKYVIPGAEFPDYQLVADEINKKLAADNVGITLERMYIPWDAWEQKINIMLSTNEEFDLFHVMQDWIPFSSYLAKGGVQDITALIDQYGPNIKKTIPDSILSGSKSEGKIYAVPANWIELGGAGVAWRSDIAKLYGVSNPTTPDELLTIQAEVAKKWKGAHKLHVLFRGTEYDGATQQFLHKGYDDFPFVIKDKLFYVDQNANVKSWMETEAFKKDAEWFKKAKDLGLVDPDVLVIKPEQIEEIKRSGDWMCWLGADPTEPAFIQKNYPDFNLDSTINIDFYEEKPDMRSLTVKNCNAVPSTSKHPEAGIKFLNWLYDNQDNYDLYMYGIEGKHYNKSGERTLSKITNPATNQPDYQADDWMTGNLAFLRASDQMPHETAKIWYNVNPKAVNSVAASFLFDATSVAAELANCKTVYASDVVPLYLGFVDFEKGYPAALDKMKKAGIDKVVAEYKKQLDAYLAKNK